MNADLPTLRPADIKRSYYDFESYNNRVRMLTYWHQLKGVLSSDPSSVLEVGVGSLLVSSYLRSLKVDVTTVDINPSLEPDIVGSILELDRLIEGREFDTVLCARVLHHVPFADLDQALEQLSRAGRRVVLTLPVDELSVYLFMRVTSTDLRSFRIGIPLVLKRAAVRVLHRADQGRCYTSGLWKIGDSKATSQQAVRSIINRHFQIEDEHRLPEDAAHMLYVLRP